MNKVLIALILCACSAACSSIHENAVEDKEKIDMAIKAPLKDLNLIREKIPVALLQIYKNPYLLPDEYSSCSDLEQEIDNLDQVLEPDLDAILENKRKNDSRFERGLESVGEESIKFVKKTTESVIPYRSWVRKLSGAERESKLVARVIKSGNLRRAFLKGVKAARCKPI
ncbi:MAG: hypothetical protein IPK77_14785 [Cellvibrio sp.]|nr:hypothetical protein [Cellvibrio sp.]